MLFHVNAGMQMALGELAAEPVDNPTFWHSRGKEIALSDERWPQGAPTSKEALPGDDVDFDRERERLEPSHLHAYPPSSTAVRSLERVGSTGTGTRLGRMNGVDT
jgi:hypothetical protein